MPSMNKWAGRVGVVLHFLIGALLVMAGFFKVAAPPEEIIKNLAPLHLDDKVALIGAGELITGLLLIIPRTMSLGTLLASGFWGGVILVHMTEGGLGYLGFSLFLLVTWVAAFLRNPATLASFFPTPKAVTENV